MVLAGVVFLAGCKNPSGGDGGDTTAPVLSSPLVTEYQNTADGTTATVGFTSNEAGTYWVVVYPATDAAPTNGAALYTAYSSAANKATGTAAANTAVSASITGLAEDTAYKAHVTVKDAAGNYSAVGSSEAFTPSRLITALGGSVTIIIDKADGNNREMRADTPQVGDTLKAGIDGLVRAGAWTLVYQWQKADSAGGTYTDIASATTGAYTPVLADHGKYIKVTVSVAGDADKGSVESEAAGAVAWGDLGGSVSINNTTPRVGDTLTADTGSVVKAEGADLSYQWKRGGEDIPNATGSTYTVALNDHGAALSVTVTSDKNEGEVSSAATSAVLYADLSGTVSIQGTAARTMHLTAITTGLSPYQNGSFHYQWKRGDTSDGDYTVIAEASDTNTYTLGDADVGKYIKVTVTHDYNEGSVTSDAKGPVLNMTQSEAKDALAEAIEEAEALRDAFAESEANGKQLSDVTDPNAIKPGLVVVSHAAKTALESAITTAGDVDENAELDTLLDALDALEQAIAAFENAQITGASTTAAKIALNGAITTATNAKATAQSSADGTDTPVDHYWVPTEDYNTFATAINTATSVHDDATKTVNDVNAAKTTLEAATTTFNGQRTYGTKDALAGVTLNWDLFDKTAIVSGTIPALDRSDEDSATVTVTEGFTVNWWKVNGVTSPVFGTSKTITLQAANYPAGTYQLSVSVSKAGATYAAVLTFTVVE
jgi:hypothetical protein